MVMTLENFQRGGILKFMPTLSFDEKSQSNNDINLNNDVNFYSNIMDFDRLSFQTNNIYSIEEMLMILPSSTSKRDIIIEAIKDLLINFICEIGIISLFADYVLGVEKAEMVFERFRKKKINLPYGVGVEYKSFNPFNSICKNSLNHYPLPRFDPSIPRNGKIFKWHEMFGK